MTDIVSFQLGYQLRFCLYPRNIHLYRRTITIIIAFIMLCSLQIGIPNRPRLRRPVRHRPAPSTRPLLIVPLKVLHRLLNLRAQIRTVKRRLVNNHRLGPWLAAARRAVPAHAVDGLGRAALLQDDADGVCEAHGVVRRVWRQQEHVALADDDVAEGGAVDDFEHHGAAVLVEPFGGFVDVVVGAGVGAADDLGGRVC